ncbi:MAG: response regulator [Deltaproteobacteria bacterium]|nr:response regulator [Deltaproteobacteria bacterium]
MGENGPAKSTILIVEDNPMMRTFYQLAFKASPIKLAFADHGQKGYDLARQIRPDLIVMDINLPGMDGLVATKLIRADNDLAGVPILAVTARHKEDPSLRTGTFTSILFKPVKVDELRDAVMRLLPDFEGEPDLNP